MELRLAKPINATYPKSSEKVMPPQVQRKSSQYDDRLLLHSFDVSCHLAGVQGKKLMVHVDNAPTQHSRMTRNFSSITH
jgi:hypothetical protein